MKIDLSAYCDSAKTGCWYAWFALHRGPVQQHVPAYGFLLCLFFFVSHAVGHRRGPLQKLFPKPKCLCGLSIIIGHLQFSDLVTTRPLRFNGICTNDRKGVMTLTSRTKEYNQSPRVFPEFLLFLPCSITHPILPSQAWILLPIRWSETDTSKHTDTNLSYCQGSLQAKAEAADQGNSPAG